MDAAMQQKLKDYLKKTKLKLDYTYKGYKINVIILTIVAVIISRLIMYLLFKIKSELGYMQNDFINSLNIWDAGWYKNLILNGYQLHPMQHERGDAANWAFFPVYPIVIRLIHNILPIEIYILGSIISTLFFCGALVLAYLYIVETRNDKNAGVFFILLMSFGVYSFYFSILYTESLYIFLLILTLYLLQKDKYILMGISGALLSGTRNMGVMLVFAVFAHYTAIYFKSEKRSVKGYFIEALKDYKLILGTMLIPLGLFLYMYYLWKLTGDPLAFAHIQVAWDRTFADPITQIIHELSTGYVISFYLTVWAIGAIVLTLYLLIQKRWTESILGLIFILIPLTAGLMSIPRYIVGSFVFVLSFIDIVRKIDKRWIWISVFIMTSLIEVFLILKWFSDTSATLC